VRKGSRFVTFRTSAIACAFAGAVAAACSTTAAAVERGQDLRPPVQTPPVATDVRLGGDEKQTRFVIDLTSKIDLAAFTLADPYRVVIDLPEVVFKLPDKAGEQGRGLVKAFRYGLVMKGGSRIVLDTTGPVRVNKAFVLAAAGGQPARLVLDLGATDRDSFVRNLALENRAARNSPHVHHAPVPPRVSSDSRPLIMIDPGHGGIDSGTKGLDGQDEKDLVLAFAQELRTAIEQSGKLRVAMTRNDDTFVALGDRVRFAREHQASLLISVHADALPRSEGQAEGASVYTLSEHASDAEAAKLAEKENKSDIIAGVDLSSEPNDVANILIDLAQRETKTFSMQFARTLVNDLKPIARLHLHPVKSAGFVVLKAPDVPSVLVELGYMSTRGDLKNLTSQQWRSRAAKVMAQAVEDFFARRLAGAGNGG
jgi:N-acetylmuramoyl-L-alanine amidase